MYPVMPLTVSSSSANGKRKSFLMLANILFVTAFLSFFTVGCSSSTDPYASDYIPGSRNYVWSADTLAAGDYGEIRLYNSQDAEFLFLRMYTPITYVETVKLIKINSTGYSEVAIPWKWPEMALTNNGVLLNRVGRNYFALGTENIWKLFFTLPDTVAVGRTLTINYAKDTSEIYFHTNDGSPSFFSRVNGRINPISLGLMDGNPQWGDFRVLNGILYLNSYNIDEVKFGLYSYNYGTKKLSFISPGLYYNQILYSNNEKICVFFDNAVYVKEGENFNRLFNLPTGYSVVALAGERFYNLFLRMNDGIAHFNGQNVEYLYKCKDPSVEVMGLAFFKNEVHALLYSYRDQKVIFIRGKINSNGGQGKSISPVQPEMLNAERAD